ncbi:unnamed protein product [Vitrella brassicaformis CCMP3155]|uniref:Uncharacterized protein n=1 Tax=Vitrella brassicaformis (strain CCMP3155) TaxID=1169540 RepID=A0A0G4EC26_VITBC|nr:unnamed protein product [Vitrella brassicaformis CCMP3155]|eukprot:CEL92881.1 unnamed protein product [Vitrella brassicaformis CCMP3155]
MLQTGVLPSKGLVAPSRTMGWSSAIGEVAIHVLQIVGVTDSRDDVTVSAADETPRRRETVRCVAVQGCACSGVRQSRRPFSAPPSSPNQPSIHFIGSGCRIVALEEPRMIRASGSLGVHVQMLSAVRGG